MFKFFLLTCSDAQINWPSDVEQPANPTIVIEGLNSSEVSLVWKSPAKQGDIIASVVIERARPTGNAPRKTIAGKSGANAFKMEPDFDNDDFKARLPVTLELRNVDNTEEYDYFVTFIYTPEGGSLTILKSQVRVIVNGEYNLSIECCSVKLNSFSFLGCFPACVEPSTQLQICLLMISFYCKFWLEMFPFFPLLSLQPLYWYVTLQFCSFRRLFGIVCVASFFSE